MFAILKIGGSMLCNKDVPYSIKWDNLERVAMEIRKAMDHYLNKGEELKLILIHGGGSLKIVDLKIWIEVFGRSRKL